MTELVKQLVNEMKEITQYVYIVECKRIVDYEVIGSGVLSVHRTKAGAFKSLFEADMGDLGELNKWYSSEEGKRKVVKEEIM